MAKLATLTLVAILAGYGFHALAQVRADIRQSVTVVGTSSSNGMSFVWFYEPTERSVYACRTGESSSDPVVCKARATLP